jgi:UDP-N-acetylglucosamine--N-acetylmuramyl-(pentapeptide) pyrophosphoryl-undecaprenol N-acetylglucosamine transferase
VTARGTSVPGAATETTAQRRRVLLAGGGSGGHVFPALAIADELAARGWGVDFTGAATGMEARLVGEHGWPFHPLAARPLVGRGLADRLTALVTLAGSTLAARKLVRSLGAAVVVGTGGYVSAPAVLGAALARVPVLLVEPNAVPGVANRWLSRFAADAALAFPAAAAGLACRSAVTGVPVRAEFSRLPEVAETAGVALLVAGGSQGAQQLNELVPEALGRLFGGGGGGASAGDGGEGASPGDAGRAAGGGGDRPSSLPPLAVLHQAGAGKAEATREAYRRAGMPAAEGGPADIAAAMPAPPAAGEPPAVRVVEFLADMPAAVGAAHLVVSRAGAITTAELLCAGRPALLVPLTLAGGHQLDNARAVSEAGAAVVVPSADLDAARLATALGELLADRERLARMAAAARAAGRPRAAAAIADRVEALAAGGVA